MRIIVQTGLGANYYIRQAWVNALRGAGHEVYFWDEGGKSAFDLFKEFEDVSLFVGSTWQLSRAIIKNLATRPHIKIILCADIWGDIEETLDQKKYPVGTATAAQKTLAEELAKVTPGFRTILTQHSQSSAQHTHNKWTSELGLNVISVMTCADITEYFPSEKYEIYHTNLCYVGGYWPYKSQNIDKYLLPLLYPATQWKIKIFGGGWNVPQHVGQISSTEAAKFYANADVIPAIVEPHASDIYVDIPARYFQVPACSGFQISQPVLGVSEIFPSDSIVIAESEADFYEKIVYYLNNPCETESFRKRGREVVYSGHTCFHRARQLLVAVNESTENLDRVISQITFDMTGY